MVALKHQEGGPGGLHLSRKQERRGGIETRRRLEIHPRRNPKQERRGGIETDNLGERVLVANMKQERRGGIETN
mgnify:CR=1 FL=1